MRIDIWGCVSEWRESETDSYCSYCIPRSCVSVESYTAGTSPSRTRRVINLQFRTKSRHKFFGSNWVSPVWVGFDNIGEAKELHENLGHAIAAFEANVDHPKVDICTYIYEDKKGEIRHRRMKINEALKLAEKKKRR